MSEIGLRMLGKNPNNIAQGIKVDERGNLITKSVGNGREVVPFIFNGEPEPTITDDSQVNSEYIDITKYKSISVIVRNRIQKMETEVSFSGSMGTTKALNIYFFDWNTEEWKLDFLGLEHTMTIPHNNQALIDLSTHPNFFWVKDFKGTEINLRFKPKQPLVSGTTNKFNAWLVGELYE